MKVFYDSTIFSRQRFGGISQYFVQLINALPSDIEAQLALRASDNIYLPQLRVCPRHANLLYLPEHKKINAIINNPLDARMMERGDYDVLHPTDYNRRFAAHNRRPVVLTVHDLILAHTLQAGKEKPELLKTLEDNARRADAIIAISNATKSDLINYVGIPEEKITVAHHGFTAGGAINAPIFDFSYILYVGERRGYKNFSTLLKAFSSMQSSFPDLHLVCTGKRLSKAEIEEIRSLGIKSGKVIQRLFAPEEMTSLYAGAECFVLPSLFEGFGMPILEAFAAECPVALSATSCMPEVAGEAGMYFDPHSPDSIAEILGKIVGNAQLQDELRQSGQHKLSEYSWTKCAEITANVYRQFE